MKTPEQRGPFGAWLVEQRHRLSAQRGRTVRQGDMAEEIREAAIPSLRDDYYRAIESGAKRPGREVREALGQFFGSHPPMTEEPGNDLGDLIGAMREQTQAIRELVSEIRGRAATDPTAQADAMGEALARHLEPLLAALLDGRLSGERQ